MAAIVAPSRAYANKIQICPKMDRYPPPRLLISCSWEKQKDRSEKQNQSFSLNHPEMPGSTSFHIAAKALGPAWKQRSATSEAGCLRAKGESESIMPLIQILLTLIVVGVLLWLVNRFIPMAGSIKSILNAVVVIGVVLWLLNVFGLFHSLSRIRVG
jgi:hypothetical protein